MWLKRDHVALLSAILMPIVIALLLLPFRDSLPDADAALLLVLVVVAVAANGYRLAGALAAFCAGASFDFFFTRPYQHLTITRPADILTTAVLLAVGLGVSELAMYGRRQHELASREAGYLDGLRAGGQAMARGSAADALIRDVSAQLTQDLGLRGCRFQEGVAGLGEPPRLQRDGRITWNRTLWDVDQRGLPADLETELLVENHGRLYGRFLLSAGAQRPISLRQRLAAVTLADQVGAVMR